MEVTTEYSCAFCGEINTTFVDISAGISQSYVEDCQVCCRPNMLLIRVNQENLTVNIESDWQE